MHTSMTHSPRRGSAILITVLVTVCLTIIIFSILELGLFERRMNHHDRLMAQARYAAESVVENACAQAVRQLRLNSSLASDFFSTKKFTYSPPPATLYAGTNVSPESVELKVSTTTPVQIVTIPSQSPDSLRGQSIEIRRLTLYGKATARDDSGREATAYCTETLQIRGQSPATNMAFYNMDLELAPGADMTVTGPIFCNKNIYFAAGWGAILTIQGTITTAGNLVWGRLVNDNASAWSTSNPDSNWRSPVVLACGYTPSSTPGAEGAYSPADFYRGGVYADSLRSSSDSSWTDAKWKDKESSQFKGFVQSRVDGTTERTLPGIKDLANSHVVIESPIPDSTDSGTSYDKNVELQKFSNKAGIIIRPPTYSSISKKTQTTTTYTKDVYAGSKKIHSNGEVVLGTPTTTTSDGTTRSASIWAYVTADASGPFTKKEGPYTREEGDGTTVQYYLVDITDKVPSLPSILTTTTGSSTSATDNPSTTDYNEDLNNGFYDSREGTWMTMYNIDVAKLKTAVADPSSPLNTYWNGIIYIDCEGSDITKTDDPVTSAPVTTATTSTVTTTTVTTQTKKSGVQLVNGGLGSLPKIPSITDDNAQGFTLATNNPLYIRGNFNADGTIDSANPASIRNADDTKEELLACLAADAITVLSNAWTNAKSSLAKESKLATPTEVSAVLMTGIVKSVAGTSNSGGMNNLPRFLEYWKTAGNSSAPNVPFGYRGSLLAFYESTRATGLWSNNWFQPPARIWGWDKRLETGRKVYGLGRVITFRRIGFSEINAAAYATNTAGL